MNRIKITSCFFMVFVLLCVTVRAESPIELELVSAKKVWGKAPHSAFTDLTRFKDKWFLAFREGPGHIVSPPAGDIRILFSEDGDTWKSAALLKSANSVGDLRDAKLSITPEGRLLLTCALLTEENGKRTFQTLAYLSGDGVAWEGPHKIGELNWWMWRVVWTPDGIAYGVGYDCELGGTRLYRSKDGLNYEIFLPKFTPQDRTNEAGVLFRKDGSAVTLVRRDGPVPNGALVGIAKGDYSKWTFHELDAFIGGPQIIETPDGLILGAGRLCDNKVRTSVGLLEPEAGKFIELLKLPSGGDTSYPGMIFHDGLLWVSYYSGHEGKASIYLAKIKINVLRKPKVEPTPLSP